MTPATQQLDESDLSHDPRAAGYRPWIHFLACLLVVFTYLLVISGGNVTSRDAGLAVPNGFWVYDHFLWLFPVEQWVGNIWHEHIHRLIASAVGMLCFIPAVVFWRANPRGSWRRWLGIFALAAVTFQGILGMLRVDFVNWYPRLATPFAIFHGITGQLVLCLLVIIAAMQSRWYLSAAPTHDTTLPNSKPDAPSQYMRTARRWVMALLAVLLLQLVLGAATRHTGAMRAIPDFPASYGAILPPMTQKSLDATLDQPIYENLLEGDPILISQVHLQFTHRLGAILVVFITVICFTKLAQLASAQRRIARPMLIIIIMLIAQVSLGALTIWLSAIPNMATAHQSLGAALIAVAVLLAVRVYRLGPEASLPQEADRSPVESSPLLHGAVQSSSSPRHDSTNPTKPIRHGP